MMMRRGSAPHRPSGREGLLLAEVLAGMVILQVGLLAILVAILNVTAQGVHREDRVEAEYLGNYLLAEIMAKKYSSVYSAGIARGTNGDSDDLGFDRTPRDTLDTDYLNMSDIAPDSFSDNDGNKDEPSLGEGDGILTRREWDDVDDYHGFTWGPVIDDEWGNPLPGNYRNFLVRGKVESVSMSDLRKPIAWNAATGAKLIQVSVLCRGETILVAMGVKINAGP